MPESHPIKVDNLPREKLTPNTIPLFKPNMSAWAKDRVADVLESGYIGQGRKVDEFEEMMEVAWDLPRTPVAVNSGTSAIELALDVAGVESHSKVLSTPMTCVATNAPLARRYCNIEWVDVDPDVGNVTAETVSDAVLRFGDNNIEALVTVNYGGTPCNYNEIREATKGRITIIEDAAHGPYLPHENGRGDYVCWSFQAIKHLTTGDGGALLCPDGTTTALAKRLRWFGLDREQTAAFRSEQDIEKMGGKLHMNDIAAAIGIENLKERLGPSVKSAMNNASFYRTAIRNDHVNMRPPFWGESNWLFILLVNDPEGFIAYMTDKSVQCGRVHRRNDKLTALGGEFYWNANRDLPGVSIFDAQQVAIPVGWWLTESNLEHIAKVVDEYKPERNA